MFSYLLLTYSQVKLNSSSEIQSKVISLRDIRTSTHLKTSKRLVEIIVSCLEPKKILFDQVGVHMNIVFKNKSISTEKEQEFDFIYNSFKELTEKVLVDLEPLVSENFYDLLNEDTWNKRSDDLKIQTSLDNKAIVETERKANISTWNIGLSGEGPLNKREIIKLLRDCGVQDYSLRPKSNDVIILGRKDFDRKTLQKFKKQHPISEGRVFTQEAFLQYLLTGKDYDFKTIAINQCKHQAIDYLKRLGNNYFPWPKMKFKTSGFRKLSDIEWEIDSALKRLTGYSVAGKGTIKSIRRPQLHKGIQELGLEYVVYHIHGLWLRTSKRTDADYSNALKKWEEDLNWLKTNYYQKSAEQFPWPR